MKTIRLCSLITLLWAVALSTAAQKVHVIAPHTVRTGEQFEVTYVINNTDVSHARLSAVPANLRLLAGPFESHQTSYQYVNGHMSGSSTSSYTFIFEAVKRGNVGLPVLHASSGARQISAQQQRITIEGSDQQQEPATQQHHAQQSAPAQPQHGGTTAKSDDDDLFITVTASKKRVQEQEPVLLTYKVYTRLDLAQLVGKMPDVKGAHTQEVKLPQQKTLQDDTYGGESYRSTIWCQYVVYPQVAGKLTIPAIAFEGTVRQRDPYSMAGYSEEATRISAPAIAIQVDPLPTKPAGYGGGVGHFTLSAQLQQQRVKAGDPIKLQLVIGGAGNLKLIQAPKVDFPKDFDVYDPKTTDKTRLTTAGVEGNMLFEYTAVPRKAGQYTVPAVRWTYYDTQQHQYRTLTTQPLTLTVEKGSGLAADAADYSATEKLDIRPITRDDATVRHLSDSFFDSVPYWCTLLTLLAAFVALLLRFHRRALERADIVHMLSKNASKRAEKRLHKARRLMERGRADRFYDEVLRALWGYVANRLNMKREQLSRDNIAEKLTRRSVSQEAIDNFIKAIDECEFERYAPGDAKGNMNRTLETALAAITRIEEELIAARKQRSARQAGYTVTLLFFLLLPLTASALTKQNGDNEYTRGNYQQAIADYQAVLRTDGPSSEVYYNLGNAYYRSDNLPQAILAYERALKLSPGNSDARFNLELARTKTIDKVTPPSELFLVSWYRAVVNLASADQWAVVSIVAMAVVIVLVLLFLFADRMLIRRTAFYGALLSLLAFALSLVFGFRQQAEKENSSGAIVTAPTVSVRKTPAATAEEVFVIHEGTRVNISDRSMKSWLHITLDDGREGWMPTNKIEEI